MSILIIFNPINDIFSLFFTIVFDFYIKISINKDRDEVNEKYKRKK